MPVTLRDVARRAGVSASAVSRTFTQGASVSDKTRAKVLKAADELGYAPSLLASSLTTRRTKLIGLVLDNFKNPIFLEVFDLFTRRLQERGLRPLLVNLSGETDPAASVRLLRQYSVDGVIVASSTLPESFARSFRDAGLPVVHSFGRYSPEPSVHVVGIDNRYCGTMAAKTLMRAATATSPFSAGPRPPHRPRTASPVSWKRPPARTCHRQPLPCRGLQLPRRPGRDGPAAEIGPGRGLFLRR